MKKVLMVLLTVLCMLSLTACGGEKEPSADNGNDLVVVKIGGSGPTSGDYSEYGQAVQRGAQIAIDEINAKDNKLNFAFKFEDDLADPEKSPAAYNTLFDWGMQVSIYTTTSGAGAAVAANYDEDKIFAITPSGSSTDVVYTAEGYNYAGLFQMCFTDPNQGVASATYIAEHFPDSKVAVIYKSDDVYSKGVYDKFAVAAKEEGIEVVAAEAFDGKTKDFKALLTKVQAAGADFIYLPMYYSDASFVITQAHDMGYEADIFGVDGMDGILSLEGFDKSYAEGIYLLTPFDATASDELTVNFVKTYKEKYGTNPNQFAADAYDSIYAIYQALNNIGVDKIESCDLYAEMINQFLTMSFDGLTGTNMKWAENGEVSKLPKCVVIKDGVYVTAE